MVIVQGRIEAISDTEQAFVHERGTPYKGRDVAVHLPNVILAYDFHVIENIILSVIYRVLPGLATHRFDRCLILTGQH